VGPACIPYPELPGTTRIFADYTSAFERVRVFYPLQPQRMYDLAGEKGGEYPAGLRAQMANILERHNRQWGLTPQGESNLQKLRAGAAAVVTGQQPVLFGGPAYGLYKALTAIRVAEELSRRGRECVPIFWLASEDHDFAEVSQVKLRSRQGELKNFVIESTAIAGAQVGGVTLGEQISQIAEAVAEFLCKGEVSELLRRCYSAQETFSSSFARMMSSLLGFYGLLFLDARDPELHALALPVYEGAAKRAAEIDQALMARGKALEHAGYHQQVKVTASSTLLFMNQEGVRTPIRRANGEFAAGTRKLKEAELEAKIKEAPQEFSGSALLRPVIQDFLLPTVAYIGGPAEVAYFAQAGVVYEKLLGRVTPILPRCGATLLDARDQRLLKSNKLQVKQVWQSASTVRQLLAERNLPHELEEQFERAESALDAALSAVGQRLEKLALSDAAKHSESKMRYQLKRLRARAAQAELRRNEEISRHAEALSASLYPHQQLQEREIGGVSYLASFGTGLLAQLHQALKPEGVQHQIIEV